jgi:hypothetical protein
MEIKIGFPNEDHYLFKKNVLYKYGNKELSQWFSFPPLFFSGLQAAGLFYFFLLLSLSEDSLRQSIISDGPSSEKL